MESKSVNLPKRCRTVANKQMTLKIDTSVHKLFRKLLKIFTFAVFGYTVALIFKEFFYIHDIFPKA